VYFLILGPFFLFKNNYSTNNFLYFFSDGAMRVDEVKLTRGVSSRPSNPKWVSFDFITHGKCIKKNLVYDTEQGGRHSRD
jgi:hypothetical protein